MAFNNAKPIKTQGSLPTSSMIPPTASPQMPNTSNTTGAPSGSSSGGGFLSTVVSALPTLGGIAGNVGARALDLGAGIAAAPETGGASLLASFGSQEAAGSVGGGLGQAAGETLKELLGGKDISTLDYGQIGNQGAQGAVYGAIPGGEGGGVMAKLGTRAVTGAVVGGVTRGIGEVGSNDNSTQVAENVGASAITGGLTFPLLGAAGDIFAKVIPNDLENLAKTQPANLAQSMILKLKQTLVGRENIAAATEEGILPKGEISVPESGKSGRVSTNGMGFPTGEEPQGTDLISTMLNKTKQVFSTVESNLNDVLSTGKNVSFTSTQSELRDIISNSRNQVATAARGDALEKTLQGVMTQDVDPSSMPLKVVNDMKRALNPYSDVAGVSKIQRSLGDLIKENLPNEQKSAYDAVNKRFQSLIGIQENLTEAKNVKVPNADLTAKGIQDAVDKAGKGAPESIKTLAAVMAILGMGGVGKAIGGTEGAIGLGTGTGVGMMMGIRGAISRFLDGVVSSPETKLELTNILRNTLDNSNPQIKTAVITTLRQMAARVPQTVPNVPNNTVGSPTSSSSAQ